MRVRSLAAVVLGLCGAAACCSAEPVQSFGGKAVAKQPAAALQGASSAGPAAPGGAQQAPVQAKRVSAVNESAVSVAAGLAPGAAGQGALQGAALIPGPVKLPLGSKEVQITKSAAVQVPQAGAQSAARNESESAAAPAKKMAGVVKIDSSKVTKAVETPKVSVVSPVQQSRSESSKATSGPVSGSVSGSSAVAKVVSVQPVKR